MIGAAAEPAPGGGAAIPLLVPGWLDMVPVQLFVLADANFIPHIEREVLFRGAKFDYERLSFTGRDGAKISRESIRHPGSVIILPLLKTSTGHDIVFIRNWRLSIEQWLLELPAGTMAPGEDPAACAARELAEETGYAAATIEPLARFYTSPGLSDELMRAFVARDLSPVGQKLEPDERVIVHPLPMAESMKLMQSGELVDAKSMLALLLAARLGVLPPA
jgi:ADP-ribose pyrophosphatase